MLATTQLAFGSLEDRSADIFAKRSDTLYGVHAYHTKVPPSELSGLIVAHSQRGELVLDPFCGSGMTGVAAALSGRRAFLNDLSPAAVHIASNYTTPCEPAAFAKGVRRVLDRVGGEITRFYATLIDGGTATVEYLVWSDRRGCPKCGVELLVWDRREEGLRAMRCASCKFEGAKTRFPLVGEQAVEANLSTSSGRQRLPHRSRRAVATRTSTRDDLCVTRN